MAFAALANAQPVPTDMTRRVVAGIRAGSHGRMAAGWHRFAPVLTTATIVGVFVIGLAMLGPLRTGRGLPESTDVPPSAGPSTDRTPMSSATLPSSIMGMPIIGVGDAIAARDNGVNDRELAVRGWFSPIGPMPCPYTPAMSPVQPVCPDAWTVLMEEPQSLVTVVRDGFEGRDPSGPSFQIDLDDLDRTWAPDLPAVGPAMPIELVVVGHFDDRRSFACPGEVDLCRDRFVVDRVAFADGRPVPTSALDLVDGGAVSTAAEVAATVSETVRGAEFLSMVAVDGELGLQRVEPSIGVFARLQGQRAIWVVRLLDRCVIRCTARAGAGEFGTYLLVDGTDTLFKIDADNVATQVVGTLPVASPVPWPPDGATVIVLRSPVGEGRPQPRVAVVDLSGRLTSAREVRDSDPPVTIVEEGDRAGFARDREGAYRLRWAGGICDGDLTVTIAADLRGIVVDGGQQVACDAMGIGRELVLKFSQQVDPADVDVMYTETRVPDPD